MPVWRLVGGLPGGASGSVEERQGSDATVGFDAVGDQFEAVMCVEGQVGFVERFEVARRSLRVRAAQPVLKKYPAEAAALLRRVNAEEPERRSLIESWLQHWILMAARRPQTWLSGCLMRSIRWWRLAPLLIAPASMTGGQSSDPHG